MAAAGGQHDETEGDQATQRAESHPATVREYILENGDLSEQFDQTSGAQTSARQLAWSYAAFISCVHARRLALGQ